MPTANTPAALRLQGIAHAAELPRPQFTGTIGELLTSVRAVLQ